VAYVRDLLAGLDARWFLCGGWAADAWLGRQTRNNADVDIAVFHDEQRAIFEHLAGWALVGHDPNVPDDTKEQWSGRRLDMPAHVHVPRAGSILATSATATHAEFEFEFLFSERSGDEWVLNREKGIATSVDRVTPRSAWGIPTVTPEVVLFFKGADNPRPQDEQDFVSLLPILTAPQRSWLAESLGRARPGHPWLAQLQRPGEK
jgi:hypothetical protein